MKTKLLFIFSVLFSVSIFAVPTVITYQGQLYTNNLPLTATQEFSFVMITNGATAWQSGATVTSSVENGLFSVELGDTSIMNAITENIFDSTEDVYLRVSVGSLGSSLTTLSPDKKITSSGYSFDAGRLAGLLPAAYMRKWTNVYIVGPGGKAGGADTNNLADALSVLGSRANPINPYTILLLPGTYNGNVTSTNFVNVVGLSRDACIITGKFTIAHDTMLQNLTFNIADNIVGIIVQTNSAYLDNLKINGGFYGVVVTPNADLVTLHNIDVTGKINAAVRDARGIVIDGLRVDGRAAFEVTATDTINYKNIICQNELTESGIINGAVKGTIRSFAATKVLNIKRCDILQIRDIDIECKKNSRALNIETVQTELEVFDGHLASFNDIAVSISNATDDTDIEINFNDVRLEAPGNFEAIKIYNAPYVSVKDCELTSATGIDINSMTGKYIYVQTSWLRGMQNIVLNSPETELFVYDSTLLNDASTSGAYTIQGYISGSGAVTGLAPRIADCRLETDTLPSQNAGVPGWNAFQANGAVGGQEDSNGNIVQPSTGMPVSP